jgi:diguanylate cyclase (GGDEF)-like protein/PAS domain S-box-containing protein
MNIRRIADLIGRHDCLLPLSARLAEAAAQMIDAHDSSVIVVDEHGLAAGIVTEGDLLHALRRRQDMQQPLAAIMTTPVLSVPADTDFRQAYRTVTRQGLRHIVVTGADGRPLGVASESSIREHLGADFFRHLSDVESIMDHLFPRLPPEARLDEALGAMEASRATCTVVVDGRRPLGILTARDVVRLFLAAGDNPPLGTVMNQPVITIAEDAALSDAAELMAARQIRHLVVVDAAGNASGLLSEHTLLRPLELELVDELIDQRLALSRAHDAALQRTARNERYQRALLDNFPFPVWLKDTESRFLAVNRMLAEALGESSAEALIGRSDLDFSPPELAEHYRRIDGEVMASRQARMVVEPVRINRRNVWHETYKAPVVDDDGQLLGTVGFARDVSRHKGAEEGMLLRNAALAGLARGEPPGGVLELIALSLEAELAGWRCAILLADDSGRHLSCGAAPSLPESYPATVAGLAIADGGTPCCLAAARRQRFIAEDIGNQPVPPVLRELVRQTGFAACVAEPLLGAEGSLLGSFVAYHERPGQPAADELALISQVGQLTALVIGHQRTAQRLQDSRDTFRGIFDSVGEALLVLGEDRRLLDANRAVEALSGHPREAVLGHCYDEFGSPGLNDEESIEQRIAEAFGGVPQVFEYWLRSTAGRIFPAEVRLQPGSYFGRAVLIAAITDITERKNARLRLEIEHDLASTLARGGERAAVVAAILRAGLRFHEFDAGALYWREPDGSYRLLKQTGFSSSFAESASHYAADSAEASLVASGEVQCNCQAACGKCPESRLLDSPALRAEELRCLTLLPILIDGRAIACLTLGGHQSTQISAATLAILDGLRRSFGESLQRLQEQEETRLRQQNLAGLFDSLNDLIFIVDSAGRIIHHNRAGGEMLGYPARQLVGQPVTTILTKSYHPVAARAVASMSGGLSGPAPLLGADGQRLMVDARIVNGHWNGQPVLIGIAQDISERLVAEERQKLAASVFEHAHEGIVITDPAGHIVEVNATFSELTGYTRAEAIGQSPGLLKSGHHDAAFYQRMWQTIRADGYWRGEVWNRKKSGEVFVELLTISTVRNRQGEISHFVGIFSDITLIKEHQQRLEHLAHFDALTQLPNRMLLADRMQLAMAQSERSGKVLAVCYLDLDGFKPVNDLYGHAVGDRLLVEVAQRLKTCVRAGDTVSRLGGDEFVLLFADLDTVRESDHAIARVISTLTHPFQISGHSIQISASIGVTLYPQDGADSDALLRHADQAMYAAKQAGRNRFHLFDPEHDRRARARHDEIARIREGLARGEFTLHYQPKVNMRKGGVIGAEALIRWQHPELGLLLPGQFLPAIEGTELACELGDWVLRTALDQLAAWVAGGLQLPVSINIAGEHLQQPDFVDRLAGQLAAHPTVAPALLELEILETAALEDIARVAELFTACRQLGVRFALDDFGTGYSSLTYFRRLPAEVLKIDQSFVRDMLDDPEDMAIVEGVIGLTQAFRRQVIAEGVESVEHGLVLLLLGCDEAQGFGIARPMPAAELPGWIGDFRPDELWSSAASFRWSRDDLPMLIAEVEHKRWKRAIDAWLESTDEALPAPTSDPRACRFGRWYYGPHSQRYAGIEGFAELAESHLRVHAIGRQLIDSGRQLAAAERQVLSEQLERASAEMAGHLRQVQAEVLIAAQPTSR